MNQASTSSRFYGVYLVIFAINLVVYAMQLLKGVDWNAPQMAHMIAWGANVAPLTLTGEPWRLFTSMFLHYGLLHLALNMYMLFAFGPIAERAFGRVRFTLVYLLSGLFGSLLSAVWNASQKETVAAVVYGQFVTSEQLKLVVAVGASGALMGITGAYLGHLLATRGHGDERAGMSMRGPLVQTIGLNLVMGAMIDGVDQACHIGGLVSGAVLGFAFSLTGLNKNVIFRAAAIVAISAASIFLLYLGLNRTPSTELLALKRQLTEMLTEEAAKQERGAMLREIEVDRKTPLAYVSDEIAAGVSFRVSDFATSMTLSPDAKRLYIAGEMDNSVKIVDLASGKETASIPSPVASKRPAVCMNNDCNYPGARFVALSPDERFAYALSMVPDHVSVVDLPQKKVIGSIASGTNPRAMVVAASGQRAYVVNAADGTVAALDLVNSKVVGKPVPMETNGDIQAKNIYDPLAMWLLDGDKELWTNNYSGSALTVFNADTMTQLAQIPLSPRNLFYAGELRVAQGKAWVLGTVALDLIDVASKTRIRSYPLCKEILGAEMAMNQDGSLMAVHEMSIDVQAVRLIKTSTLQTVGVFPMAGRVGGLRFLPDGKRLVATTHAGSYVKTKDENFATILDTSKSANVPAFIEKYGKFFCTEEERKLLNPRERYEMGLM